MAKLSYRKVFSVAIVTLLLLSGVIVGGISNVRAGQTTENVDSYIVWGEIRDKFGATVDTAIVVAINENTGNATWVYADNGTYTLDLADIEGSVGIGDVIKLICSNALCKVSESFIVGDNSTRRTDFILAPKEPAPPNVNNPSISPEHNSTELDSDLAIIDFSFSDERPVEGDAVTLTAVVTPPIGLYVWSFDLIPFDVAFYLDQKDAQHCIEVITVTPSEREITTKVSVVWDTTNVVGGYHTIIVVADPKNKIIETNETNNELSKEICILTVEFCINSTITQINQLKSYVSSLLSSSDAKKINNHLDKTIDELDDALEKYNKDVRKLKDVIKNLNHAIDECWKAIEETSELWEKNKLTVDNTKYIINTAGEIISSILETSYVALHNATAKDITKVENIIVEIRIRYIFEKLSGDCKKVDEKLANAFQHYQKAMEALAEGKDYLKEIEHGYDKLLKAKEDVSELVKKGKITAELGNWTIQEINKAILVFPPNLKMTPYDIVVQGPIAKDYKTKITVTVHNVGVVSARDVKVEIWQMSASTLISSFTIPKIEAGDIATKTIDWTPTTDGTHDISVVLDAENTVVEPTKEDNVVSSGVYVSPKPYVARTDLPNVTGNCTVIDDIIRLWNDDKNWNGTPFVALAQNLTILGPWGYLYMSNSTLKFESGLYDGQYGLFIKQGGMFDMLNGSLVTASSENLRYIFLCDGNMNISKSTIEFMWGNITDYTLPGGIQLSKNSNCTFVDSKVWRGKTHDIYCDGASPTDN